MNDLKRIAAINDLSCVGKCSLTVSLPVISAAGVECSCMPTAVLSTHTAVFTGYTVRDLSDDMLPIARHWKKEGIHFDGIYSGYMISPQQGEIISEIFDMISDEDMERLFARAAKIGLGIELNYDDMKFTDSTADTILRPYRIAKSHGCKFYLGSDAHGPSVFASVKDVFERAVRTLDLTENDKFHIS